MTETMTYEELRQRVLDGDTSVTAAALEKARRDAEFAGLQGEAERLAAERAARAEQEAAVTELRAGVERLATTGLDDMRAAYRAFVSAAGALQRAVADWQASTTPLRAVANRLGAIDVLSDLPGVLAPEAYVAEAVEDFQGKYQPAGMGRQHPHLLHDDEFRAALRQQEEDRLERHRRENPTVRFRTRHSGYEPGATASIDAERAALLVSDEIAEWVD